MLRLLLGASAIHAALLVDAACPAEFSINVKMTNFSDTECSGDSQGSFRRRFQLQFWTMWDCGDTVSMMYNDAHTAETSHLTCTGQCVDGQNDFTCEPGAHSNCGPADYSSWDQPTNLIQECGLQTPNSCDYADLLQKVRECSGYWSSKADMCIALVDQLHSCGLQDREELTEFAAMWSAINGIDDDMEETTRCVHLSAGGKVEQAMNLIGCATTELDEDVEMCKSLLNFYTDCPTFSGVPYGRALLDKLTATTTVLTTTPMATTTAATIAAPRRRSTKMPAKKGKKSPAKKTPKTTSKPPATKKKTSAKKKKTTPAKNQKTPAKNKKTPAKKKKTPATKNKKPAKGKKGGTTKKPSTGKKSSKKGKKATTKAPPKSGKKNKKKGKSDGRRLRGGLAAYV